MRPADEDVFATGAAEKVEHYEICAYESLIQLGDQLRVPDAVELFQTTLSEEQEAADELKVLAQKLGPTLDMG